MQQIADWLEKLGMSEYAERFAENDIEIDTASDPGAWRFSSSYASNRGRGVAGPA